MNKLLSFVKLDYMTLKPYLTWKTALLFLAVLAFIGYGTGEVSALVGMCMMFSVIFACYPFAVGDRNGIDTLYATLPITKKTVVIGRYVFTLALNLFIGVASLLVSAILMMALKKDFNGADALIITLVCFALFSVVEAVQLPIYFRFGYAKAKLLAYLPLAGFPAVVVAASTLLGKKRLFPFLENVFSWVQANAYVTAALAVILWASIMIFSVVLSLRFYMKREF